MKIPALFLGKCRGFPVLSRTKGLKIGKSSICHKTEKGGWRSDKNALKPKENGLGKARAATCGPQDRSSRAGLSSQKLGARSHAKQEAIAVEGFYEQKREGKTGHWVSLWKKTLSMNISFTAARPDCRQGQWRRNKKIATR